jgi:hypothetical protein
MRIKKHNEARPTEVFKYNYTFIFLSGSIPKISLDPRLRGNDGAFSFIVFLAQAGIQFCKLSLISSTFFWACSQVDQ